MPPTLTDTERKVLDIERRFWLYEGVKAGAIRDELDMSSTRFYQVLAALVRTEAAQAYDPITCRMAVAKMDRRNDPR